MEKLLELLNEYEKEIKKSEFYEWEKGIGGEFNLFRRDTRDEEGSHLYSDTADTYVISKKYGFIGWLVENEKIDYMKLYDGFKWYIEKVFYWEDEINYTETYDNEDTLIMLLAIQDEPINFLISILK